MRIEQTKSLASIPKWFSVVVFTMFLAGLAQAQSAYYLTVKTGGAGNASTDALVYARLTGSGGGDSGWINLDNLKVNDFELNSEAVYPLGSHDLSGTVQVQFKVESNGTVDESWYLEWFAISKKYGTSKKQLIRQVKKTWIHPETMSPAYYTQIKNPVLPTPTEIQPDYGLSGTYYILKPDGTLEPVRSGYIRPRSGYSKIILVRNPNGTYRMVETPYVPPTNNQLTDSPPTIYSTGYDRYSDCPRYSLQKMRDGTNRIKDDCTGKVVSRVGVVNQDEIRVSPRPELIDDGEMYPTSGMLGKIYFENRTNGQVDIYKFERGFEQLYRTLPAGGGGTLTTSADQRWRVKRNGRHIGDYIATDNPVQMVTISTQATENVRLDIRP